MIKRILNRHKPSNQNINFRMVLSVVLALMMLVPSMPVRAATTKTMTVEFEEQLDGANRSKTIVIPNLKNITRMTTNTGNVNHSINGEKVTISVSNGAIFRQIWNDKKETKNVSNYLTSATDSFTDTSLYSDPQGFSGVINKNGNSFVISGKVAGNYTYSLGTLYGAYLYECEIENSATGGFDILSESKQYTLLGKTYGVNVRGGNYVKNIQSFEYEGGIGILNISSVTEQMVGRKSENLWQGAYRDSEWGNIIVHTTPSTFTMPDTRVWQQNYSGSAYKGGYDNYYKYTVTIEYIDNSDPIITLTQPLENLYFSKLKLV